jgi:hypothetical protein
MGKYSIYQIIGSIGMPYISPNASIAVTFERYTEFRERGGYSLQNNISWNTVDGVKSTATDINSGFVYIFRKYNAGMHNGDGSIIAVGEYEMPLDHTINISLTSFGEVRQNFFMYSAIKLSETNRLEIIRKDLSDCLLKNNNKNSFYRVQYIPLIKSDLFREKKTDTDIQITGTVNYAYFFHDSRYSNSAFNDVDFEIRDSHVHGAVLYLHDWFGYLRSCAEKYQEEIKKYYDFFNTTVALSKYNSHPQDTDPFSNAPTIDYTDQFTVGELFLLTEMIDKICKKDPGKRQGNLRMFNKVSLSYEYDIINYDGSTRKESVNYTGPVPAYQLFLQETEEQISALINDLRSFIQRTMSLLKNRSANAAFLDYLFSNDNDKKLFLDTLGLATENYFLTMYAEDRSSFSEILTAALAASDDIIVRLPVDNIEQLYRVVGENPVLAFIVSLPFLNILTDESSRLVATLVAYSQTLSFSKVVDLHKLLSMGILKDLRQSGEVFSISAKSLYRYYQYIKKPLPMRGKKPDYSAMGRKWFDDITDDIHSKTNIPKNDIKPVEYSRFYKRWGVKIPQFEEIKDIGNLRKRGIIRGSDAFLGRMSLIVIGINTVYQLSLLNECKSLTHAVPHVFNLMSGTASVISSHLASISMVKAGGFAGGAFALAGAESLFNAYLMSQANDYDSSFFHVGASLSYFGAAAVTFKAAAAGASMTAVAPAVMALVGLGFLFTTAAGYMKDEDIDVFLKYCVWGFNYREDWDDRRIREETLPSWWPNKKLKIADMESRDHEILLGGEIKKGDAYRLYDGENTIKANTAILNIVRQIPPYTLNVYQDPDLVNKVIPQQFVIDLNVHSFEPIKTIEARIRQEISHDHEGNPVYGTERHITIDPLSEDFTGYFYKKQPPMEPITLPPVAISSTKDEIGEAFCLRILVIPNQRFINDRLRQIPQEPYELPANIFQGGNMVSEGKPIKVEAAIRFVQEYMRPVTMIKIWRTRRF